MMGKMGLGLLGLVSKSLLSGGDQVCGGGRGGQGGKRRGRNQKAAPLEEAFAALLDKGRAAPEHGLKSPLDRNLLRPSPVIIRSSTCAPWGFPLSRRTRLTPGAKRR